MQYSNIVIYTHILDCPGRHGNDTQIDLPFLNVLYPLIRLYPKDIIPPLMSIIIHRINRPTERTTEQIPQYRPPDTPLLLAGANERHGPWAEYGIERSLLKVIPKVVGCVRGFGSMV